MCGPVSLLQESPFRVTFYWTTPKHQAGLRWIRRIPSFRTLRRGMVRVHSDLPRRGERIWTASAAGKDGSPVKLVMSGSVSRRRMGTSFSPPVRTISAGAEVRIVSANVSGLNAAKKSGFFAWPHVSEADILLLQETSADDVESIGCALGYQTAASDRASSGNRKAHGGVAILSRVPITDVVRSGPAHCERGQFVSCSIGSLRLASIYVTLDATRDQFPAFTDCFAEMLATAHEVLVAGDFNTFRGPEDSWRFHEAIARREVGTDDYARGWLEDTFAGGWIDAARAHHKSRPFHTWWWSDANFARKRGTRLDYILVSKPLVARIDPRSVALHSERRRGGHAQLALSLREEARALS